MAYSLALLHIFMPGKYHFKTHTATGSFHEITAPNSSGLITDNRYSPVYKNLYQITTSAPNVLDFADLGLSYAKLRQYKLSGRWHTSNIVISYSKCFHTTDITVSLVCQQ